MVRGQTRGLGEASALPTPRPPLRPRPPVGRARDDNDAAQATLSLVVNRQETFSPIEKVGKFFAR
jgi:hypothetical protein